MFYLSQLIAMASAWVVFVISPGPSFATTVHYATARSRRDGVLVAIGVTCAFGVWLLCSLVGLSVLFTRFSIVAEILKLLGACYLAYLGIKTILHTRHSHVQASEKLRDRRGFPWHAGFVTTMGNPKVVVFFSSLFALFLPAGLPVWMQGTMAVLLLLFAIGWYSLVACVFSLGPITNAYHRAKCWIDRCTGGVFVALGLMLVVAH